MDAIFKGVWTAVGFGLCFAIGAWLNVAFAILQWLEHHP